ncbi:ribosome small subunit-dependent GTPase A [Chryseobacterium sp.]|uniref:ribosome small subunit-dependent GTPase A n=1 Tax=Chryseobacterium sp. TaxID=1871047 RepID=UPI0025BB5C83|nr:ribosome small subunit-dependent GTPase A [Chryseobacterium sp.]
MINLNKYGWTPVLDQQKQNTIHSALSHGRITIVHRTCCEVISRDGIFLCELAGNMMFGKSDDELPCVGDWVIFQPFEENKGIIVDMLPREKTLYRKKNGTLADKQMIASHIDKAFIVQSLDDNFNARRVERFMVQIKEENINPVLVLNKSDLAFDREKIDEVIKHLSNQLPIFFTSIHNPETILQLRESISEGETVVFVGSSGVGKSSLINTLCERTVLLTSDISQSTGKGRHTSTRREMVLLEGSGILIDTPGIREFGITVDDSGSLEEILDISDYTELCRFKDCTHTNEAGCAVLKAVHDGNLDIKVYQSYLKLKREALHFSSSEHEKRKKMRAFSKIVEEAKNNKANR